jgi:hypothetical protein
MLSDDDGLEMEECERCLCVHHRKLENLTVPHDQAKQADRAGWSAITQIVVATENVFASESEPRVSPAPTLPRRLPKAGV